MESQESESQESDSQENESQESWEKLNDRAIVSGRYTADCPAEVTHALRWHSEYPTNIYSTTTYDIKRFSPDTLISESVVSFADSPFKLPALLPPSRFLDSLVLALGP